MGREGSESIVYSISKEVETSCRNKGIGGEERERERRG